MLPLRFGWFLLNDCMEGTYTVGVPLDAGVTFLCGVSEGNGIVPRRRVNNRVAYMDTLVIGNDRRFAFGPDGSAARAIGAAGCTGE